MAGSRLWGPALDLVAMVNGGGGKLLIVAEYIADIAKIREGGPAQMLCSASPCGVVVPAER